jgi:hypothetical protein
VVAGTFVSAVAFAFIVDIPKVRVFKRLGIV